MRVFESKKMIFVFFWFIGLDGGFFCFFKIFGFLDGGVREKLRYVSFFGVYGI